MQLQTLVSVLLVLLPSFALADQEVDVQWSICDSSPQQVLKKLGEGTRNADKETPITYFDTNPPRYTQQGIMFRTKTSKGEKVSSVKVRFDEETSNVPDGVNCVFDRYGEKVTYTCEKQSPVSGSDLWSEDQTRFVEHYNRIDWNELTSYGPYKNPKWKIKIKGYKAAFDDVAAASTHLMEIEVKTTRSEAQDVYDTITKHLKKNDITLCPKQESKTLRLFRAMGLIPHS